MSNCLLIDVRGVDLDLKLLLDLVHVFPEDDGDRIRFFPCRASRHPNPENIIFRLVLEEPGESVTLERRKRFRIPKKTSHVDKELFEEQMYLVRIFLEVADICVLILYIMGSYPPLYPAVYRVLFVQ